MKIEIPDPLVKRATKAANWQFGKDTPENQICEILEVWTDGIERQREKEEAELNARLAASKKIIARYNEIVKATKTLNGIPKYPIQGWNDLRASVPKCKVYLCDGTDRIIYGLFDLGELGYMAFSDPAHKKPTPIVPGLMSTWEETK
jgi:hypothetical protein